MYGLLSIINSLSVRTGIWNFGKAAGYLKIEDTAGAFDAQQPLGITDPGGDLWRGVFVSVERSAGCQS